MGGGRWAMGDGRLAVGGAPRTSVSSKKTRLSLNDETRAPAVMASEIIAEQGEERRGEERRGEERR